MQIMSLMRHDVVTVNEDDTLALALQIMGWNGMRHLPVVKDDQVVGILSDRDLLARTTLTDGFKIEGVARDAMSSPVRTAPPTMSVEEAAAILVGQRIDALPIVGNGHLVGIVTATDVLGHVAQCDVPAEALDEPTIGGLMIRRVATAHPSDTLPDAASRMSQHGIRHLPVVDGEGRVVGILSERDLRTVGGSVLEDGARGSFATMRVDDVMTRDPRTVQAGDPLALAVRALVEDRFGALPVVDDDERLVGILSYVDLLRYLAARLAADAA